MAVEPAFANEDPEGWCEVLAWEEARADALEAKLKKLEPQPTIADYLEANKEMMDKTGCKVVTIASLKKFGGLDD